MSDGRSPHLCARNIPEAPLTKAMREIMAERGPCALCPTRVRPDPMPPLSTVTWCVGTDSAGWTNSQVSWDYFERDKTKMSDRFTHCGPEILRAPRGPLHGP